jgi:hypothetical protein
MTHAEKLREKFETGKPFFNRLYALNDTDLKEKLKSIFAHYQIKLNTPELLESKSDVVRVTKNDEPSTIEIHFYDGLIIDAFGIASKPEHYPSTQILEFTEDFYLNENGMESSIAKLRNMIQPVGNFFAEAILHFPNEIVTDEKFQNGMKAYHKSVNFIKEDANW